jgi:hypothetical protein
MLNYIVMSLVVLAIIIEFTPTIRNKLTKSTTGGNGDSEPRPICLICRIIWILIGLGLAYINFF